mmetsp:Transcript_11778/g.16343  ORF Transcript_11778/g.16343 Transcript_11778/m.16343 type:complete len:368 (+) Transcript_11778:61-1164(+)
MLMNVDSSQTKKQVSSSSSGSFEPPNTFYAAVARAFAKPVGYFYRNANPQQMFAPATKIEILDVIQMPHPKFTTVPTNPTLKQVVRLPVNWNVFAYIIKQKGIKELIRMVGPPVIANSVLGTVIFEGYRWALRAQRDDPNAPSNLNHVLKAGAVSGFTQSFLACPMDSVKIRLSSEHFQSAANAFGCPSENIHNSNSSIASKVVNPSIIDLHENQNVIQTIKHMRGEPYGALGSLYQGMGVTIIRDSLSFAVFFWSYEFCKKNLAAVTGQNGHPMIYVLSGGVAGMSSFLLAHPFDTIKEELMHHGPQPIRLQAAVHSFSDLVRSNGTAAFTGGGGFRGLLRVFPASALGFLIYEITLKEFDRSLAK